MASLFFTSPCRMKILCFEDHLMASVHSLVFSVELINFFSHALVMWALE